MQRTFNILFLSSTPEGGASLDLAAEQEIISEALERVTEERFSLHIRQYVTYSKLQDALRRENFSIVHIAGHGTKSGLVLERDESHAPHVIPPKVLMEELATNASIQCLILNACYAFNQLAGIKRCMPFVIAMENKISDSAGRAFTRGFYNALVSGQPIIEAYGAGDRAARAQSAENYHSRLLKRKSPKLPLPVIDGLVDIKAENRIQAALWIGATQKNKQAVNVLVQHLQNEQHPEVRYWSIIALGQIGSMDARQAIEKFNIQDRNDQFALKDALI